MIEKPFLGWTNPCFADDATLLEHFWLVVRWSVKKSRISRERGRDISVPGGPYKTAGPDSSDPLGAVDSR